MVCLRDISLDTLHKGDTEDNNNNNNNNNNRWDSNLAFMVDIRNTYNFLAGIRDYQTAW